MTPEGSAITKPLFKNDTMTTAKELYDRSMAAMEAAERLWKAKDFDKASTQYLDAATLMMSAILDTFRLPHAGSVTSVIALYRKFKSGNKQFCDSNNAYTLNMLEFFHNKVGYFENKTAFEKPFRLQTRDLHTYLEKEASKRIAEGEDVGDPKKSFDTMVDSLGDVNTFMP